MIHGNLQPVWIHCQKHNIDYPQRDGCPFCNGTLNYEYNLKKKVEEKHNKEQRKLAKEFKVGNIVISSYGCDGFAWDTDKVFKIKEVKRYKDGSIMIVLENQRGADFYREPQYLKKINVDELFNLLPKL